MINGMTINYIDEISLGTRNNYLQIVGSCMVHAIAKLPARLSIIDVGRYQGTAFNGSCALRVPCG